MRLMKNIICLLAAAALVVGCAKNEMERGGSDTSVTTETGTSGSVTNGTNSSTIRTNDTPAQTPSETPSQTPTQTPRGN